MRALHGLREVAGEFDAFILDLWGLIHDGERAYPPAEGTLRQLKAAGKKTLLLSNAPRRAYALVEGMTRMGLPRDLYGEVLSSGEAVREALIKRDDPFFASLGKRAYHMGPDRDRSVFDDTGIEIVPDVETADFLMNTGPTELDETVDHYVAPLKQAAARNLPMVCANPDFVVLRAGREIICAGAFAQRYIEMGGKVGYRGKPDPAIYNLALEKLGVTDRSRVAVVGDALETDIKGANAAGLSSLWCTGGIHAAPLSTSYGVAADPVKAEALAREAGQMPSAIIPGFIW